MATPEALDTPSGNDDGIIAIVARTYAGLDSNTGEVSEEGLGAYIQIAAFADPARAEAGFAPIQTAVISEIDSDELRLEATAAELSAKGVAAYAGVAEREGE